MLGGGGFSIYILTYILHLVGELGFLSIYILTYIIHLVAEWGFLNIYTYIYPSFNAGGVSRYIYLHISFI